MLNNYRKVVVVVVVVVVVDTAVIKPPYLHEYIAAYAASSIIPMNYTHMYCITQDVNAIGHGAGDIHQLFRKVNVSLRSQLALKLQLAKLKYQVS